MRVLTSCCGCRCITGASRALPAPLAELWLRVPLRKQEFRAQRCCPSGPESAYQSRLWVLCCGCRCIIGAFGALLTTLAGFTTEILFRYKGGALAGGEARSGLGAHVSAGVHNVLCLQGHHWGPTAIDDPFGRSPGQEARLCGCEGGQHAGASHLGTRVYIHPRVDFTLWLQVHHWGFWGAVVSAGRSHG